MTEVIELNAEQRAAMFGHSAAVGSAVADTDDVAWLAVPVPGGVAATSAAAQVAVALDVLVARATVASALSATPTLLPPATMRALLDREAAFRDIESRYGLLRSGQLAQLRGSASKNASEYASALRRAGKVVGLTRGARTVFPAYQFRSDGTPIGALAPMIKAFRDADWSDESIVLWFTAPNGYLDGADPAALLVTEPSLVEAAAASASADW